jgi:hypothetical protein
MQQEQQANSTATLNNKLGSCTADSLDPLSHQIKHHNKLYVIVLHIILLTLLYLQSLVLVHLLTC